MRSLLLLASLLAVPAFAQTEKAGCKDHPLFPTRMPDYVLVDCKVEEYGAFDFGFHARESIKVEGRYTFLTYSLPRGPQEPSALAVVRNYQAAIEKAGGTVTKVDEKRRVNGLIKGKDFEATVQAEKGNGKIWLRIVEKAAMAQYIVADAAAMSGDLKTTGHVAVYGIFFDTNKADVKPESKPALEEIAKLLKAEPALELRVVGHTDSVGQLEANLKLSLARAEAVMKALVKDYGIDAKRLSAHGVASLAPVASNDTDEGRAKNRRVELVKK